MTNLTRRGPNANTPAKLPQLQATRVADPQIQKALEALREWVEVRLGSRGDRYEKAVTLRELEQLLDPIEKKLSQISSFDGSIESLSATNVNQLPSGRSPGRFALLNNELYFDTGLAWKKVTLT